MANRWTNQFGKTFEKEVNKVFCQISFGASGAPTLATNGITAAGLKGVASIAQGATGVYTLTLQDSWVKLLNFAYSWDTSGAADAAPLAPVVFITANGVTSNPGTIEFTCGNYTNGADTNPASGEILRLEITLGNSTAF